MADDREYAVIIDTSGGNAASVNSNSSLRVLEEEPSTVHNGQQSVSTAGTAEALNGGTSLTVKSITIKADGGNGGNIYVGDSSVTSSNGFVLSSGESVSLAIDDVSTVFIDADNSGEGVSWVAVT